MACLLMLSFYTYTVDPHSSLNFLVVEQIVADNSDFQMLNDSTMFEVSFAISGLKMLIGKYKRDTITKSF